MDNNQIFGIITLILCSAGYLLSWKYAVKDKHTLAVGLLVVSGLVLRIYLSMDLYLHVWDERYHALVAKNMMQHFFTPTLYDNPVLPVSQYSWTSAHIWLHKQPFPLWVMAISMKLFGVNEIALRLPSIVLTTIGIGATYVIGKYFFNRKVAFLAAFFFSINGLIIELTGGRVATDHIDTFFLVLIELSICFGVLYVKNRKAIYNVLAGLCMGAAILTKWLPALIVLPVWVLVMIDAGKFSVKQIVVQSIIMLGITTVVFLPWQLYIYHSFPYEAHREGALNFQHFTQVLDGQTGPFYYYLDKIRINYNDLIYLPLLWFLWITIMDSRNLKRLAIAIWIMLPIIFFSFAKTKMQAYILFIAPALFFITADFFYTLKAGTKFPKWLAMIVLILLIGLPVRYSIERIKPFDRIDRNPAWVRELKGLDYNRNSRAILFNYKAPIEAMFYTNLTAYPNIPNKATITDLLEKNYKIIINDDGTIPQDIASIKGIIKRKFIPPVL